MNSFIQTLEKLGKCLLSPHQKKKPKQKDIENLLEMLHECYSHEPQSNKTAAIQSRIFSSLMTFSHAFKTKLETLDLKILAVVKLLDWRNSNTNTVNYFLGRYLTVAKEYQKYSAECQAEGLKQIGTIVEVLKDLEFEKVLPGLWSFLCKSVDLEYSQKFVVLDQALKSLEIMFFRFMKIFEIEATNFFKFSKNRLKLKEFKSIFSSNLKLYQENFKNEQEEPKTAIFKNPLVSRFFETLFTVLQNLRQNFRTLGSKSLKIQKSYLKILSGLSRSLERYDAPFLKKALGSISLKLLANLINGLNDQEASKIENSVYISKSVVQEELGNFETIFSSLNTEVQVNEKLSRLNLLSLLIEKSEFIQIDLNSFFQFWAFKLSSVMLESFALKNQDLIVPYTNLDTSYQASEMPPKAQIQKLNFLTQKSLIDFLSSTLFSSTIFDKMRSLSERIVLISDGLIFDIFEFGSDLAEFLETVYYYAEEDLELQIELFRGYEKVDRFLDDVLNWLWVGLIVSDLAVRMKRVSGTNKSREVDFEEFEEGDQENGGKTFLSDFELFEKFEGRPGLVLLLDDQSCHRLFKLLNRCSILEQVLKSFFLKGRETTKFSVIKSLFTVVRVQASTNLFERLAVNYEKPEKTQNLKFSENLKNDDFEGEDESETESETEEDELEGDEYTLNSINDFNNFLYSLLAQDDQMNRLTHFAVYTSLLRYLKAYNDFRSSSNPLKTLKNSKISQTEEKTQNGQKSQKDPTDDPGERPATPLTDLKNLSPFIYEKIELIHLNSPKPNQKLLNLKVLSSITFILSQIHQTDRIIFEMTSKIFSFLDKIFKEFYSKTMKAEFSLEVLRVFKSALKILATNFEEYKRQNEVLVEKDELGITNVIRMLHLELSGVIEYRSSFFVNSYLDMMVETVSVLKGVSMTPQTDPGRFSTEDALNVTIPSALEPLIHELWPRFNDLCQNVCTRCLANSAFGELILDYARAMSGRRRTYIESQFDKMVDSRYPRLEEKLAKKQFFGVVKNWKKLLIPHLKRINEKDRVIYTEYVGVNLLKFFEKIRNLSPDFLKRGERVEAMIPFFKVYFLGCDFETVNSLKVGLGVLELLRFLGLKEESKELLQLVLWKRSVEVDSRKTLEGWFEKIENGFPELAQVEKKE